MAVDADMESSLHPNSGARLRPSVLSIVATAQASDRSIDQVCHIEILLVEFLGSLLSF
jgi:hypothetical protein